MRPTLILLSLMTPGLAAQDFELSGVPAGPATRLQIYDVRDLFTAYAGEAEAALPKGIAPEEPRTDPADAFVGMVRTHLQPGLAKGQELKMAGNGSLVALLTEAQHGWLQEFLRRQRSDAGDLLELDSAFVVIGAEKLAVLGLETGSATILDSEESSAMRERLEDAGCSLIEMPPVTTRPLQPATASVVNQVSYVADWELKIVNVPEEQTIADPVIEIAQDGVLLFARGLLLENGMLGLHFSLISADLEQPVAMKKVDIGRGRKVEVAVPRWERVRVDSAITVPEGSEILVVSPAREGRAVAVLLRGKRVE